MTDNSFVELLHHCLDFIEKRPTLDLSEIAAHAVTLTNDQKLQIRGFYNSARKHFNLNHRAIQVWFSLCRNEGEQWKPRWRNNRRYHRRLGRLQQ